MSVIDTREEPILKIETKEIIAQCGSDPSQVIAGLYRRIVDDGDLRSLKRSRWSAIFLPGFKDVDDLSTSRSEYRHLSIHALPEKRLNHMLVPMGNEIAHLGNLMPIHIIELIHEVI